MKQYFSVALAVLFCALMPAACTTQTTAVKFMSYNIRNGRGAATYRTSAASPRSSAVVPDVVALQEVDSVTGRMNGRFIPEELGRMTGMHARFCRAIDYDGGGYGIGLLSRAEPLSVRRIPLPGREEARVLLMAEFPGYVVCVTHLSLTPEDQRASLPIIRQATDTCRKPVLLAGDFNMDDAGKVIGGLGGEFRPLSDTAQLTFPGPSFDTHRLHTGPRPAAVGENRRTHGGLHHRRFGPLPAVVSLVW
ncbi:MAG: endonuclease/exonuclease/phosphatase family protein [Alistipes sp.]